MGQHEVYGTEAHTHWGRSAYLVYVHLDTGFPIASGRICARPLASGFLYGGRHLLQFNPSNPYWITHSSRRTTVLQPIILTFLQTLWSSFFSIPWLKTLQWRIPHVGCDIWLLFMAHYVSDYHCYCTPSSKFYPSYFSFFAEYISTPGPLHWGLSS